MAKYRIVRVARAGVPEVDEENKRLGPLGAEVVGASYTTEDELVAALKGADGVLNYQDGLSMGHSRLPALAARAARTAPSTSSIGKGFAK